MIHNAHLTELRATILLDYESNESNPHHDKLFGNMWKCDI